MKKIEVAAAIIVKDHYILATQKGYGPFEGMWEFPGGKVEPLETPRDALIREIKEETSVDVMIDPTFRETVSYFPKRDTQKTVVYFIARAKNYDFVPQEEEIAEIRWVDIGYASSILTYENDKNIVNKAKTAIKEF